MDVIKVPKIWLAVGDEKHGRYPLFFSPTGENGNYELVAMIHPKYYEVIVNATLAYNEQRNQEGS